MKPGPRRPLTSAGAMLRYRAALARNARLLELAILRRDYEQLVVKERAERRLYS